MARQYDIVVFGASGYTGKYTAEHIAANLPTNIKWAIAGRSASKLADVASECKALNADRLQPAIEVCNLDDDELSALAKKTTIMLATVGPYCLYGEKPFKACAENGTHYFDVTGEVAYVANMIKKYEKVARSTGAIMIPQIGIDSAPADLITWTLVELIKKKYSVPTQEVVLSCHEMKSKPSGGTLNTFLTILDVFSIKEIAAAHADYSISPIPGPKTRGYFSFWTALTGVRVVPELGILTTSPGHPMDKPIVHRSWGLLGGDKNYGPQFSFNEYMRVKNYIAGIALHLGIAFASLCLLMPFVRKMLRSRVFQPGEGESREDGKKNRMEYRGIATPDSQTPNMTKAYCRAYYDGAIYGLTGVLLAEAAVTVLRDQPDISGGIWTPACLGQKYIDRLHAAGFKFETKFLDD